jgi:protein-S-isoprenylcysteine O-methyltransferase Ste14
LKRFQFFIKSFLGIMFFNLILFIFAWRLDYYQGWICSGMSILGLIIDFLISGADVELIKERGKPGTGVKKWDKQILGLSALTTIIAYAVAGLDSGRFHWSAHLNLPICLLGIILFLIGQLLFLFAKKTNIFFSSIVRIQDDRGHSVCDTGLYKFVRHPGYSGMIISWIGFPLLIASTWTIIPVGFAIILLLVRTNLEDNLLINELSGYSEYVKKTRYRLIPLIW